MAYINSTRTVVNNVGTDIALAGAGNLFTVSGSLGGTKSLTLSDGFINNGAPEANLIVPLLFPNGHNDLGPSLYLEITVAGVTNPIPVVSNQNGTLAPIPHHEMTEGGSTVYKVIDPNTILNVYYTADYDGNGTPAFVIVGNPLVLSSNSYSIYANGWNDRPVVFQGSGTFVLKEASRYYSVELVVKSITTSSPYNYDEKTAPSLSWVYLISDIMNNSPRTIRVYARLSTDGSTSQDQYGTATYDSQQDEITFNLDENLIGSFKHPSLTIRM